MKLCVKPLGPQSLGHPSSPAMTKPSQPAATWRIYMIIYIYLYIHNYIMYVYIIYIYIYVLIIYCPRKGAS